MRTIKKTLLAAALGAGLGFTAGPASAQFNQFYFFGDSLTDAGSFKPLLPPGTGEFTTNPGPIWAEVLAQRYGATATPANQGGNDYAVGGARVTQLPGVPDSPPTVDRNAGGHADPDVSRPRAPSIRRRCTRCGRAPTTCSRNWGLPPPVR